ncbi:hypothetical protein JTB14_010789 [Gonioctena quinquepunctata]|nr:hypothetical protein JTB14_010789 [Gonioctena quinquepunctata]
MIEFMHIRKTVKSEGYDGDNMTMKITILILPYCIDVVRNILNNSLNHRDFLQICKSVNDLPSSKISNASASSNITPICILPIFAILFEKIVATELIVYLDENEILPELSIIRDQVIVGIRDLHVKEVLLRDGNITLEKVSEYCRAVEVSKQQIEEFQREASVNINVVKRKSVKRDVIDNCNFCGYSHRIRNCPAFGKECGFCKKKGHFVKKSLEFSKNKKNILAIQEYESEPDDHDCMEDPNEHNSID